MYQRFYGFKERPFSLLPDPDFLFLSDHHKTALDLLELAVVNQSGFCVISGEIGAGKTTLIRELLNRLRDDVRVGLVSNTHQSFGELMQWIMSAYGLSCGSGDRLELHERFVDFVIQNYARRQTTLLIIDEAQNLSISALEELRMLSNINSDKDMVLQIVLVGQGQLRDKLKLPVLQQFAQRLAIDFHLCALDAQETCRYIRHRTGHAGAAADLFSDAACAEVYRFSNGIPRLINRICDLALVYAYAGECPQITSDVVQAVADDQRMGKVLEATHRHPGSAHLLSLKNVGPAVAADVAPRAEVAPEPVVPAPPAETPDGGDTDTAREPAPPAHDDRPHRGRAPVQANAEQRAAPQRSIAEAAAPVSSELHALVVDAERQKRGRRRGLRAGVWLWAGMVVAAAAATWSSVDVWYPIAKHVVADLTGAGPKSKLAAAVRSTERQWQTAPEPANAPEPTIAAAPLLPAADPAPRPEPPPEPVPQPEGIADQATARRDTPPVAAQPESEAIRAVAGVGKKIEATAPGAAEQAAQQAQQAALRLEQQRLARAKQEAERLSRERLAAERKLAEQRRARQALEQQARRDQAQSVESPADAGAQPGVDVPGPVAMPAQKRQPSAAAQETDARADAVKSLPTDAGRTQTPAVEDQQSISKKFLANPCNGPTAKFMSTCF